MKKISGQAVSRFSFGCMQFGSKADRAASAAIYGAMREAGVNFFDTAHVYTSGKSEEILGELIKDHRDDLVIATKAGYTGGAGAGQKVGGQTDMRLRTHRMIT